MVRGQGVEPRFTGPKPAVLPLDDPRISWNLELRTWNLEFPAIARSLG